MVVVTNGVLSSTERVQFENGNSGIAFPFYDDADIPEIARELIVDACVVVPKNEGSVDLPVDLVCIHVSPDMISAMFSVGGAPALYACVPMASFVPFSPVPLKQVSPGAPFSGLVSFGDPGPIGHRAVTERGSFRISESAIVRPVVGRLLSFIQPERGMSASGTVYLSLPDGVEMSISDDGDTSYIDFSASQELKESLVDVCSRKDERTPITSINGVRPNSSGKINIVLSRG